MSQRPTLQTPRLVLRPFEQSDAAEVQRLAGDRAIADTTASIPHPYPDGVAEAWIATHAESFEAGRSLTLAVTRADDGTLVGAISLMGIAAGHQAEMGYWIGVPYWGRGYCTEAGRAVVACAFATMGLVRVHAHHFTRNPASGRVMQKIGMRHEGSRRQHAQKADKLEDVELYGILKEDWRPAGDQDRERREPA